MSAELAVMFGVGILSFLFFDGWYRLRDDHPSFSMLFFGMGMVMINFLAFLVNKLLAESITSITSGNVIGNALFQIVMWVSILTALYIFGMILWDIFRWMIFFMFSAAGKRPPKWSLGPTERDRRVNSEI